MTIAGLEFGRGAEMTLPLTINRANLNDPWPGLCPITTRIHRQRAADGTRNTGHESRIATQVCRKTCHLRTGDTRLGINQLAHDGQRLNPQLIQCGVHKHNGAIEAPVAH